MYHGVTQIVEMGGRKRDEEEARPMQPDVVAEDQRVSSGQKLLAANQWCCLDRQVVWSSIQRRERAIHDVRRHVVPYRRVVLGKLLLGDLVLGPVDAVRMGELHHPLAA